MNKYSQLVTHLDGYFVHSDEVPVQVSDAELNAAEQEIGYPFPLNYREFLRDFSGYNIDATFPVRGWLQEEGYLGVCKGIKVGSSYGLVSKYKDDLANKVIAPEMLPISEDESGKVCLFLAGPQKGTVQFWHRDEARAPYDYANLYFIANSFDEFMNSLKKYED